MMASPTPYRARSVLRVCAADLSRSYILRKNSIIAAASRSQRREYPGGPSFAVKRDAVEKLAYPAEPKSNLRLLMFSPSALLALATHQAKDGKPTTENREGRGFRYAVTLRAAGNRGAQFISVQQRR